LVAVMLGTKNDLVFASEIMPSFAADKKMKRNEKRVTNKSRLVLNIGGNCS
jgi:hypothetical protein